jgi:hypothetical protein
MGRILAANGPLYTSHLAHALTSLWAALRDVGRHADSFAAAKEAVQLWCTLATDNPAIHGHTYRQQLAALQRTYLQAGLTTHAIQTHLRKPPDDDHRTQ